MLIDGRYKVVDTLKDGVYIAEDTTLENHRVILKEFACASADTALTERRQREKEVLCQLDSPYICRIFDYVEKEGQARLVLEYIQGVTLKEVLKDGKPFNYLDALVFAEKLFTALAECHTKHVIHRDLKPENIMIRLTSSSNSEPVLIDFNACKTELSDLTVQDEFVGNRMYCAAEQVLLHTAYEASDVYSVGCIIFEMLTGVVYKQAQFEANMHIQKTLKLIRNKKVRKLIGQCLDDNFQNRPTALTARRRIEDIKKELLASQSRGLYRHRYKIIIAALVFIGIAGWYVENFYVSDQMSLSISEELETVIHRGDVHGAKALLQLQSHYGVKDPYQEIKTLYKYGDTPAMRQILGMAIHLIEHTEDPVYKARYSIYAGRAQRVLRNYPEATRHFKNARTYSTQAGKTAGVDAAFEEIAKCHLDRGDLRAAKVQLIQSLSTARFSAYFNLALIESRLGNFNEAQSYLLQASHHIQERPNKNGKFLAMKGWLHYKVTGDAAEGEKHIRKALRIAKELGDFELEVRCNVNLHEIGRADLPKLSTVELDRLKNPVLRHYFKETQQ